jgi:hypothetical protein
MTAHHCTVTLRNSGTLNKQTPNEVQSSQGQHQALNLLGGRQKLGSSHPKGDKSTFRPCNTSKHDPQADH